jgi:uncharacterized Ntn-hydrolase superfamily protein
MAESTADVKRDIEQTRTRIADTLVELENKMNVTQLVRDNPWPAIALALGAGVVLSGTKADVKAAAATVVATKGASGRVGSVLDELVSQVVQSFHGAFEQRIEALAGEVKRAIGAPLAGGGTRQPTASNASSYASAGESNASGAVPRAD